MSAIKAVVFDWAGTMVDFGCLAPVEALVEAFAAEGVALSAADARRDMGRAKLDHVRALLAHPPVARAWAEAKGANPGEDDVDRIYRALEPLMIEAAGRCSELIPGAAAVADGLRALGVRIGSGTGYTRAMMAEILPRAAAQGYAPDVVVCAGETPSGRPSPLMTWQALITLDAWPARLCVKVDDAEVGIEEGRAAGCWTVGRRGVRQRRGPEPGRAAGAPRPRAAGPHRPRDAVARGRRRPPGDRLRRRPALGPVRDRAPPRRRRQPLELRGILPLQGKDKLRAYACSIRAGPPMAGSLIESRPVSIRPASRLRYPELWSFGASSQRTDRSYQPWLADSGHRCCAEAPGATDVRQGLKS